MAMFTFTAEKSSEDQNRTGGTLAPGYYNARILKCYPQTSNSGNAMLVAELDALTTSGHSACRLFHYMPVSVTWKLEQFAAAIGMKFGPNQPVSFDPATLTGKFLVVRTCMDPDPDTGKLYTREDAVFAPGTEPHLGAMTEDELFAVGLKSDGTRPKKGAQRPAQQPRRAPVTTNGYDPDKEAAAARQHYINPQSQAAIDANGDDDIPF